MLQDNASEPNEVEGKKKIISGNARTVTLIEYVATLKEANQFASFLLNNSCDFNVKSVDSLCNSLLIYENELKLLKEKGKIARYIAFNLYYFSNIRW